MKVSMIGRQMEVPDDVRALCEKKLARFDKFFRDDAVAYVTLRRIRERERLELTISSSGTLFRSEEENTTFQNALDAAIESIERQIRKNKTKLAKRMREGAPLNEFPEEADEALSETPVRVKTFDLKPMTTEEAILQMDLLGHTFFVFVNIESGQTNVVYRRNDGGCGLIVPKE